MSVKRAATTELNHDNWDQDDPSGSEEMGSFKAASKDVLEKRVIRTAKRRGPISNNDEIKKGVFSGFGGFNKSQPSSFDFLANLTNGNKNNSSPVSKSDTVVTSTLFSNKPLSPSSGAGILSSQTTTASTAKTTFGIPSTHTSSLFGGSPSYTQTATSLFTASKADSTVGDSPLKAQSITSSTEVSSANLTKTVNLSSNVPGSQVTSSLLGVSSSNVNMGKSLFSTNSSPFKMQPVSSSTTMQSNFGTTSTTVSKPSVSDSNKSDTNEEKKMKYYAKLKGLNESVSDWIKKHVEETPLCILSPIFKDYEKHLKEMQEEYQGPAKESTESKKATVETTEKSKSDNVNEKSFSAFASNINTSPHSNTLSPGSKSSPFSVQNNTSTIGEKPNFLFGIKPSGTTTSTAGSPGFSFGISTTQATKTTSSPFSATSGSTTNGSTPFSFGTGKPFSFSSNVQKPSTESSENGKEEDDEPPKVEFTPVVEENSVYDKKCKIFVKKDGNFVDKGVGTLYIKKIEDSGKYQLLVRANTNLGNVMLNLILASAIPTQRMGKNNVMMVCIPTPDAKPPPTPILIRVKTSEEADALLETLNKYKS